MCGLTSMSISELAGLMEELGQPKFRARQVFEWISRGKASGNDQSAKGAQG